ncbi:Kynurenine 3-monooxygenase [Pseudolycoriella hygida]|uniref:Kynurenine 3-monooxygenase n=1 Tax=Pseudolycoriella hygida TaxID=35572 RepID=A0A9Q0S2L6_9DIPT|nr:Kynurenine 3-monooxygenase [Pseudolycoriella hygida]
MSQATQSDSNKSTKITIVGGGLVGSLAALHLGKRGYEVHLYEYRDDIRKSQLVAGRSINLALSARGRRALTEVGLEDVLLDHGIPMRGRMLHDIKGRTTFVPYDRNTNQCIYSVGRKHLNEILLTATENYPNVHLHFNHKLMTAKLKHGELNFVNPNTRETFQVNTDLVIGCDGAYSAIRKHMLQHHGFDYSQTYIEHGYIELCIPSNNNEFAMPPNYLHIWPRGKFMMIALPNQDKTWTVTLFMPFKNFEKLKSSQDILLFFEEHFADAVPLIGERRLIEDFAKTKPQHLVSVKCHPYHIDAKVLLMGDAAHAMVPFFGQGMNAGFEDCTLLSQILDKYGDDFKAALSEFSETRWENAHTICDLAMYNYIEMRDLVTRLSFRIRKSVDDFLFWIMPTKWMPLYNSVSFSHMPYKKCLENRKWQDNILNRTIATLTGTLIATLVYGCFVYIKNSSII